jgi:large conductance mechanosensitive channel
MFTEFKKFIMRGNVMDLAVAVILGAAFGKIVSSLVADIFTPVLSLALGKIDFANMFVALNGQHYDTLADAKKAAAATINYGLFLNAVIEFLIVKQANRLKKPEAAPTTKPCPECCTAIPIAAKRCPACTSVVAV